MEGKDPGDSVAHSQTGGRNFMTCPLGLIAVTTVLCHHSAPTPAQSGGVGATGFKQLAFRDYQVAPPHGASPVTLRLRGYAAKYEGLVWGLVKTLMIPGKDSGLTGRNWCAGNSPDGHQQ